MRIIEGWEEEAAGILVPSTQKILPAAITSLSPFLSLSLSVSLFTVKILEKLFMLCCPHFLPPPHCSATMVSFLPPTHPGMAHFPKCVLSVKGGGFSFSSNLTFGSQLTPLVLFIL